MTKTIKHSFMIPCLAVFLLSGYSLQGAGPLPEFTYQGVALHPDDLKWIPTRELEHPSLINMEGRVKNPLGKYYMYYAPHKHHGIGLVYSDSLDGPWKEYQGNPVIEGPAAPDIRWIEEKGKFYMWGHRANKRTELWTSEDGLHFEYQSVSVDAGNIGTKSATYSRVYEYPLEQFGSKYIMLYSGKDEEEGEQMESKGVCLAYSTDAEHWTQLKPPLVEPAEGENGALYCAALFQWDNRNFIVYQDNTAWRGGKIKYVEVNRELDPVGTGGKRFVLMDPPAELNFRYRSAEFYREGDTITMFSGADKTPRVYVYATASAVPNLSEMITPMPSAKKGSNSSD